MFKYAALISYSGTRYCGWQKQKGSGASKDPSLQETIEKAVARITSEEPSVVGSGRTDSGVHAVGQVAHFRPSKKEWDPAILVNGLNSLLPRDIRIQAIQRVSADFHAQRSAERKQYSFYFLQGPCSLPHLEPFTWWIRKRLDVDAMQQSLNHLVGEHDFKPFQSAGAKPGPTVRKILEGKISREAIRIPGEPHFHAGNPQTGFELVRVRLIGTGFLKQMVRGISGTLLQVGEGRRPADCTREILAKMDRDLVGPTAPGRALWLEQVWYPDLSW